jgi:regulator of protease activity HflC (stomatin/prohibitin superfamily)
MANRYVVETPGGIPVQRMIRSSLFGIVMLTLLLTWACGIESVKPDAGHEAVLIEKPLIFGHGGVDPVPVKTGRQYVWWTTEHVIVNMQPLQYQVHFDDLMSSDGVPLDFDAVIRLQITDSVLLIKNFGPKWYENNIEKEFSNRVRQAVRKHGMNETAISTVAIDAIDTEVSHRDGAIPYRCQIARETGPGNGWQSESAGRD